MSEASPEMDEAPAHVDAAAVPATMTEAEGVFALVQRQAYALAQSELVPKAYQEASVGKAKAIANCMIAVNLASLIRAEPLMVMQNLDIIHGKPSFSAKFLISCINACGRFKPLQYRITGEGDDMECVAHTETLEGVPVEGPPVTMAMAKAEGWISKSGSKWKTMPGLMIRYRSAAFFARTICPELTMGMGGLTTEEERDIATQRAVESRTAASTALRQVAAASDEGVIDVGTEPAAELPPDVCPTCATNTIEPDIQAECDACVANREDEPAQGELPS